MGDLTIKSWVSLDDFAILKFSKSKGVCVGVSDCLTCSFLSGEKLKLICL